MASLGVAPTSALREPSDHAVGVDRLPVEMNDMKIRDDKELEPAIVDGNVTETGHIIVTTTSGRNGQPKLKIFVMAKDEPVTVKDAVQKLQLRLLEGIQDEDKLFAAGALMSQSDYHDVVIERSIANMCGYPLCGNTLPSERPRKGRYRISLKEHKVYDLQETYMYCSPSCVINSRAFAGSLQEERSLDLKPAKLNEVLRLFAGMSLEDSKEGLKKDSKSVFSDLRVQEKPDLKGGDVSMEEWIGPSNAIEGYVPQRDHTTKPQQPKELEKGQKPKLHQLNKGKNVIFSEMDFTSAIIMQDEYNVSKAMGQTETICHQKNKEANRKMKNDVMEGKSTKLGESTVCKSSHADRKCQISDESQCRNVDDLSKKLDKKLSISDPSGPDQNTIYKKAMEADSKIYAEKASASNASVLKSSLKSSTAKKVTQSVTWADEKTNSHNNKNLCDYNECEDNRGTSARSGSAVMEVDDDSYRLVSAEACARALTEAAESVAAAESDVSDAVTDAGIIILPSPRQVDGAETLEEGDMLDTERAPLKWPNKPGLPNSDLFGSDDSWYDNPPDDFSLTLSPFSTMFMALFAWTSSSSLAHIYGHDESLHEEYLSVNGREYPRKVVLTDGRSSEIRQALAGCLARALPALVADLRLPTPLSTLEREIDHLLDTMSFMDPIPALKMKQWQLLVLLFLDALSICRVPTLASYMTGRRVWLPRVLEGAKISAEEYEIMKDLIIPLGRVPQFVMQSGG